MCYVIVADMLDGTSKYSPFGLQSVREFRAEVRRIGRTMGEKPSIRGRTAHVGPITFRLVGVMPQHYRSPN